MKWKLGVKEGLIILVSVLAAFIVDRWWDGYQAQKLEREILNAVADEVSSNVEEIGRVIDENRGDLPLIDRMLQSEASQLTTVPEGEVLDLVIAIFRVTTFNPVEGSSNVLVQTPVLDAEGIEARRRVALAQRALEDALEEHPKMNRGSDLVRSILARYAAEAPVPLGSLPQMLASHGPPVLASMRGDAELIAAMVEKAHLQQRYIVELETALTLLSELDSYLGSLD